MLLLTKAVFAIMIGFLSSTVLGLFLIPLLKKIHLGQKISVFVGEAHRKKEGTPTMGGLIILAAILIPTLLFAKLDNIYVIIMLITTVWLGALGFIDDYIKVFKKNKAGLSGKLKVVGQIVLGIVVGSMIYFHPDITIKEKQEIEKYAESHNLQKDSDYQQAKTEFMQESSRSTKTTIPFVKNNEFDYSWLIKWVGDDYKDYAWIIFIPIVIFFITAISNGANLTDGIDGLATGTSAIIGACLAVLAWVSGNKIFADYLNIMYIPNVGELTIYIAAFVGATIGFLWYNTYPAQIFMGDTGSLAIGGIIAVFAILIRKELLIPILCGVFIAENLSVVMQVSYFKFTKKKYGEGKRIFLMAPLHHHYQKKGYAEPKIVQRFMIISIILAVTTIVTLKLR